MVQLQIVFAVAVFLTVASGLAATGIVLFGDTRRNSGQGAVASKFARIGAAAIMSPLALPL